MVMTIIRACNLKVKEYNNSMQNTEVLPKPHFICIECTYAVHPFEILRHSAAPHISFAVRQQVLQRVMKIPSLK